MSSHTDELPRKLRVLKTVSWKHHRGGWRTTMSRLRLRVHSESGTPFIGCTEDHLLEFGSMEEPWVGVLHQVPRSSALHFPDLNRFLRTPQWRRSEPACQGLWVLSDYARHFLRISAVRQSINVLPHPACTPRRRFKMNDYVSNANKVVLSVGHHQRRYQPFVHLPVRGFQKVALVCADRFLERFRDLDKHQRVLLRKRVSNQEYDRLLSESIVFLNLIDASGVNTIVECMVRGTPLLINRLPAVVEYLGENYPLYYEDIDDAAKKLHSEAAVLEANQYLRAAPIRDRLRINSFVRQLADSAIYRSLPPTFTDH